MCEEVVVFMYEELHRHLKAKHGITVALYRPEFMDSGSTPPGGGRPSKAVKNNDG